MRLRGPWIVRGSLLDTSVSSQSGTIGADSEVSLAMGPYTFFPSIIHRRGGSFVNLRVRYHFFFPPSADVPILMLYNPPGANAPYIAKWRHINP